MQMNHVTMEEAPFSCTSQITHYAIAIKHCKNHTFLGYWLPNWVSTSKYLNWENWSSNWRLYSLCLTAYLPWPFLDGPLPRLFNISSLDEPSSFRQDHDKWTIILDAVQVPFESTEDAVLRMRVLHTTAWRCSLTMQSWGKQRGEGIKQAMVAK